jgi:3-oxoacyl-(acyl-carrier-protein) synthase
MTGKATAEAQILGIGLATALGQGLDENCAALHEPPRLADRRVLQGFGEPVEVAYLAPPHSVNRRPEDYFHLVDVAVEEALMGNRLPPRQRSQMPLFIGSSSYAVGLSENMYRQALEQNSDQALALPLAGFEQLTTHLREKHRLCGPDYLLNTACTASANALLAAARQINLGRCEYALVIGIELFNHITASGFFGMQLLTSDMMRPFDRRRNGLILGEGCGALLLGRGGADQEKLIITSGASGCDTHSITASNPDGGHIATIMRTALRNAGISSTEIVAAKAHGTASPLNDDGEAAGMRRAFGTLPPFFVLKPHIGHTLGACGAIETGLLAGSIKHGLIPASGGFEQAAEQLGVTPMTEPMNARPGHYMLNFFGFGGNNSSLILTYRR